MVKTLALSGGIVIFNPVDEAQTLKKTKMKPISPTPYPDVNEILDVLLSNAKEILQEQFVGMYLFWLPRQWRLR